MRQSPLAIWHGPHTESNKVSDISSIGIFKIFKSLPKSIFRPIPVKFPFKYFFITVISTILIWTVLVSAIIYRNAYKDDIGQLADLLQFEGRREKHKTQKAIKSISRTARKHQIALKTVLRRIYFFHTRHRRDFPILWDCYRVSQGEFEGDCV